MLRRFASPYLLGGIALYGAALVGGCARAIYENSDLSSDPGEKARAEPKPDAVSTYESMPSGFTKVGELVLQAARCDVPRWDSSGHPSWSPLALEAAREAGVHHRCDGVLLEGVSPGICGQDSWQLTKSFPVFHAQCLVKTGPPDGGTLSPDGATPAPRDHSSAS